MGFAIQSVISEKAVTQKTGVPKTIGTALNIVVVEFGFRFQFEVSWKKRAGERGKIRR